MTAKEAEPKAATASRCVRVIGEAIQNQQALGTGFYD